MRMRRIIRLYYPNKRVAFEFNGESFVAFNQALEGYARETVQSLSFQPIQTVAKGYYEVGTNRIVMNSRLTDSESATIHELAHAKNARRKQSV